MSVTCVKSRVQNKLRYRTHLTTEADSVVFFHVAIGDTLLRCLYGVSSLTRIPIKPDEIYLSVWCGQTHELSLITRIQTRL